jgi:pantoate--beta-alanine ligase
VKLVRTAAELAGALESVGQAEGREAHGAALGFVPTMGALHEGHLSLMREARRRCGRLAVSIFVNPLQFGPGEDLSRYPRPFERDAALCEAEGVDVLYAPDPATMYPAGYCTAVEVQGLSDVLEGRIRPGHFRGVATVVLKLLNLVRPECAFFGQKDYQQTVVIRRMVRDLDVPCRVEVLPTVREPDGLAMSSRNVYLGAAERQEAPALYRCLQAVAALAVGGEVRVEALREAGLQVLAQAPLLRLEYLEIADRHGLEPLPRLDRPAVALIAARLGATRLIDNLLFEPAGAAQF